MDRQTSADLEKQLAELNAQQNRVKAKLAASRLSEEKKKNDNANVQVPASPPRRPSRPQSSSRPKPTSITDLVKIKMEKHQEEKRRGLERDSALLAKVKKEKEIQEGGNSFARRLMEQSHNHREEQQRKALLREERKDSFDLKYSLENSQTSGIDGEPVSRYAERKWGIRISPTYFASEDLAKELQDMLAVPVRKVFGLVTAPDFEAPDTPNFVVIGIVSHKGQIKQNKFKKKMMTLTLTDLHDDIPLTLHNKGLEGNWKIREGTVVAVLNPDIFVIQDIETKHKSPGLSVTSSDNAILELGQAKDLGYCAATTKASRGTKKCHRWVNSAKATYCEYHEAENFRAIGRQRMEFQSVVGGGGVAAPKLNGVKMAMYQKREGRDNNGADGGWGGGTLLPDRPGAGRVDLDGNKVFVVSRGSQYNSVNDVDIVEVRNKKELAARQKERQVKEEEIRKKLAQRSDGEHLRRYDEKGNLIDDDSGIQERRQKTDELAARVFSVEHLRRIGFDPTNRIQVDSHDRREIDIGSVSASSVKLGRPKKRKAFEEDSDSDDLEIV